VDMLQNYRILSEIAPNYLSLVESECQKRVISHGWGLMLCIASNR